MNKTVTEFLDGEYAAYGMYTIENRAIPSVIDGFKPTQRKIAYISQKIWKGSGKEKPLKIFQLGGKIAAEAAYHHGDCLDPETPIVLGDGTKITIGEWFENYPDSKFEVLCYDETNQKVITSIGHSPRIGHTTDLMIELEMESGEIFKCTENHPFYTKRGWVEAKDLLETDEILTP